MYVCMYVCMYVYMYVYVCVCMCMYVCMYVCMSILVTLILGTLTAAVPGCSTEVQYSSIQEAMQWSVHAVHTTAAILMQISLPTLGKPNSCCIFIIQKLTELVLGTII